MKRPMFVLSAVLFSGALLTSAAGIGVAPAGATTGGSLPCISWSIQTPYSGYGVIASTASGTCVATNGFGGVYVIVKMWDLEADGHNHLISSTIVDVPCSLYGGVTYCGFNFLGHTAVAPPRGRYHAELEVIGDYTSQAPGLELLDDANSAVFCDAC